MDPEPYPDLDLRLCGVCDKCFFGQIGLSKHMKKMHPQSEIEKCKKKKSKIVPVKAKVVRSANLPDPPVDVEHIDIFPAGILEPVIEEEGDNLEHFAHEHVPLPQDPLVNVENYVGCNQVLELPSRCVPVRTIPDGCINAFRDVFVHILEYLLRTPIGTEECTSATYAFLHLPTLVTIVQEKRWGKNNY